MARDILYNLNVKNSCGLLKICGTSIDNAFSFSLFPYPPVWDRRGFIQSIQSKLWDALLTCIYDFCVISDRLPLTDMWHNTIIP